LVGRSTVDLSIIAPDVRAALFEQLQRERRLADAELQVTCKDGMVRDCLGYADIIELPGGPHLLVSLVDITERKQVERQLRDSEERFRLVVENSPSSIVLWNDAGAISYVSPAFETTLGWPPATLLGLAKELQAQLETQEKSSQPAAPTAESLAAHVGTDVRYARVWRRALELARHCGAHPGEKVQVEAQMPHISGDERTMVLTFQGFRRSSAGSEVVAVAHDITAHVALERLLQQTNAVLEEQVAERTVALAASVARLEETLAELRRANRGKDAFMAAMSHELRTPLTAILSMADLLATERRGPLTADQVRYVTTIGNSGRRLLATVNNVVLYTQLMAGSEPLEPRRCSLGIVCEQAIHTVKEAAGAKQQHISQVVVPRELEMVTDVRGVINVLHMLLDNAVKFTPVGGAIVVEVAEVASQVTPQVLTDDAGGEGCISLVVADTGVGMSPGEMDGIFTAFMQSDLTLARRFDGLGLGLAYVREMVARLGGTVSVASEVGGGSRFTVMLPLAFPSPEAPPFPEEEGFPERAARV
jgi:signal transduction histidine kinase